MEEYYKREIELLLGNARGAQLRIIYIYIKALLGKE